MSMDDTIELQVLDPGRQARRVGRQHMRLLGLYGSGPPQFFQLRVENRSHLCIQSVRDTRQWS